MTSSVALRHLIVRGTDRRLDRFLEQKSQQRYFFVRPTADFADSVLLQKRATSYAVTVFAASTPDESASATNVPEVEPGRKEIRERSVVGGL